jgi:hypothetical protein
VSIDPGKKPSLLAPLGDAYKLADADADRLLANIQATFEQEAHSERSPSFSPGVGAAAGSSGGKNALLLGVSCLALAIGGALAFHAPSETRDVASIAMAPPPVPTTPNEPAREPESAHSVPSVSIDDLPAVPPSPRPVKDAKKAPASASSAPAAVPAPVSTDTLERETLLLADARQALKVGDGDRALALLDEHARLFPNGWLANDRAGERIVVLCSLGRRAEATREATAFLDGRPKSPLTRRVEMSCAGQPVTKAGK